jgi:hypothetical protein
MRTVSFIGLEQDRASTVLNGAFCRLKFAVMFAAVFEELGLDRAELSRTAMFRRFTASSRYSSLMNKLGMFDESVLSTKRGIAVFLRALEVLIFSLRLLDFQRLSSWCKNTTDTMTFF